MRTTGWMQTFTGRKFYPLEPEAADICIEDIAHALSLKCRFCGHTREFYSVAQHSVIVADAIASISIFDPEAVTVDDMFWGLMHDAAEAYLPDVVRPIKSDCCFNLGAEVFASFDDVENRILRCVASRFGLTPQMPEIVKRVDTDVLMTEARDVLVHAPKGWGADVKPLKDVQINAMPPEKAEHEFLDRFQTLSPAMKAGI